MPIDRDVVNLIQHLLRGDPYDSGDASRWLFCESDTPKDAHPYLADGRIELDSSMRDFIRDVDDQLNVLPKEEYVFGYPLSPMRPPRQPGDKRPGFVIMPYSNFDKFEDIKETITEAGKKHNFDCEVSLDLRDAGNVQHQIWRGIRRAEALVADLTGNNPNVFYEVGLAHALGKPINFITQDTAKLPFDVLTSRCIRYDKNDLASLGSELEKAFAAVPARYKFDLTPTPV